MDNWSDTTRVSLIGSAPTLGSRPDLAALQWTRTSKKTSLEVEGHIEGVFCRLTESLTWEQFPFPLEVQNPGFSDTALARGFEAAFDDPEIEPWIDCADNRLVFRDSSTAAWIALDHLAEEIADGGLELETCEDLSLTGEHISASLRLAARLFRAVESGPSHSRLATSFSEGLRAIPLDNTTAYLYQAWTNATEALSGTDRYEHPLAEAILSQSANAIPTLLKALKNGDESAMPFLDAIVEGEGRPDSEAGTKRDWMEWARTENL